MVTCSVTQIYYVLLCNVTIHLVRYIIIVPDGALLESKCIFCQKKLSGKYTLGYKVFVIFLFAYCVVKCDHIWATSVWLVLVQTGPSCPHAHNILFFVTPFCWLDCLQTPSQSFLRYMGVVWLGCPNSVAWGSWLWLGTFWATHIHMYHYGIGYT